MKGPFQIVLSWPVVHSAGAVGLSSGWKLHCVGAVVSCVAALASATSMQSAAVMIWPEGVGVALLVLNAFKFWPSKSVQDCARALDNSGKPEAGPEVGGLSAPEDVRRLG